MSENQQILANRGLDSTFVHEANSTRLSPKPRQSQVIKLMVRTQVTRGRDKAQDELIAIQVEIESSH